MTTHILNAEVPNGKGFGTDKYHKLLFVKAIVPATLIEANIGKVLSTPYNHCLFGVLRPLYNICYDLTIVRLEGRM